MKVRGTMRTAIFAMIISLVSATIIGLSHLSAFAEPIMKPNLNVGTGVGVPGFLDPSTGTFKPVQRPVFDLGLATPTFTGKFVFSFSITILSSIPATDQIGCFAFASTFDANSTRSIFESAAVQAKRAGSTATCTVTIPYSWALSSASTDTVFRSYEIFVPTTGGLPSRGSQQSLASVRVPANGSTTTVTIKATI